MVNSRKNTILTHQPCSRYDPPLSSRPCMQASVSERPAKDWDRRRNTTHIASLKGVLLPKSPPTLLPSSSYNPLKLAQYTKTWSTVLAKHIFPLFTRPLGTTGAALTRARDAGDAPNERILLSSSCGVGACAAAAGVVDRSAAGLGCGGGGGVGGEWRRVCGRGRGRTRRAWTDVCRQGDGRLRRRDWRSRPVR